MEIQVALNLAISWLDEELFASQEISSAWNFCSFIHTIDKSLYVLQEFLVQSARYFNSFNYHNLWQIKEKRRAK
jgi:hypothetical protein